MNNVLFEGNVASYGGALYLNGNSNALTDVNFEDNTAVNGSAIYLGMNKILSLDSVSLSGNDNSTGFGTVYVDDHGQITVNGLTRDADQRIYLVNYTSDVLYVAPVSLGEGNGLTPNDASELTSELLTHLNNGGRVIFLNDKGEFNIDQVKIIAKTNIQFIGNTSTIKSSKNDKSLFNNHLTPIKSCS